MESIVNAYLRCSTDEQKQSGLGLDAQQAACVSWCRMRGLVEPVMFIDEAESGATPLASRPAGKRLLDKLNEGPCTVVVSRLDRLFRNSADATATIERWTKEGVQLISISEGFDMSTAVGRFIARTMANFAELERELIGERTTAALDQKRQRGERISRDSPFGSSWQASGRVNADGEPILVAVPCAAELDAIRVMRNLRRHGWSLRKIARELDRRCIRPRNAASWCASSVKLILDSNRGHRLPAAAVEPAPEESALLAAEPVQAEGKTEEPAAAEELPPAAP